MISRGSNGRSRTQRLDVDDEQSLFSMGRFLLVIILIFLFPRLGGGLYETVDVTHLAISLHGANPILHLVPISWFEFFLYTFHPLNFRYVIAPITALVVVMIAGTLFVQDIYELKTFKQNISFIGQYRHFIPVRSSAPVGRLPE